MRRALWLWTGWFYLSNLVVLALVSLRFLSTHDASDELLARAFTPLMLISHNGVLAAAVVVAAAVVIGLLPRRRLLVTTCVTVSSLLVAFVLIDTVVYAQYRFHINGAILHLLTGGSAAETFVFPSIMYVQAALAVVLIVAVETLIAIFVTAWVNSPSRKGGRFAVVSLIVMAVAMHALHAWADVTSYTPIARQRKLLPAFQGLTVKKTLTRLGLTPKGNERQLAQRQGDTDLAYPLAPMQCSAKPAKMNVILIVIDSWRRDSLTPAVTPNLARFAADKQQFRDHISGGSATRTGMFSLFYGIPATYWHDFVAERKGPVLVSELVRQNYDVRAFRSAPLTSPEFHWTIFSEVHTVRLLSDGETPAARDRDLTTDFIDFLGQRDESRPFFSVLFYDSPHAYDVPAGEPMPFQPSWKRVNYFELDNDSDPGPFRNRYLNSLRFVDRLAGEALDAIKAHRLLENSIVIVTGDHGQEFNETRLNYWGHNSNFTRYQTGVPLVIHWPGQKPAIHGYRTSHFDMAPTLLRNVLGCSAGFASYSVGHDLFTAGGRELLLLSNFTDSAMVEPRRITTISPHGTVDVVDEDYRPIDSRPDSRVIGAAMELQSRFYKK
jgi:uncharacterized protein